MTETDNNKLVQNSFRQNERGSMSLSKRQERKQRAEKERKFWLSAICKNMEELAISVSDARLNVLYGMAESREIKANRYMLEFFPGEVVLPLMKANPRDAHLIKQAAIELKHDLLKIINKHAV